MGVGLEIERAVHRAVLLVASDAGDAFVQVLRSGPGLAPGAGQNPFRDVARVALLWSAFGGDFLLIDLVVPREVVFAVLPLLVDRGVAHPTGLGGIQGVLNRRFDSE